MFNELIAARRIANIGAAAPTEHGINDAHHSPEDWLAFFHSMEHHTVFERRFALRRN